MATKRTSAASEKVFVRGPDGALYILSKNKPPYKLRAEESRIVGRILSDAQEQVTGQLKSQLPGFGSAVNIHVPAFPFN
jgi:hypothetical protein